MYSNIRLFQSFFNKNKLYISILLSLSLTIYSLRETIKYELILDQGYNEKGITDLLLSLCKKSSSSEQLNKLFTQNKLIEPPSHQLYNLKENQLDIYNYYKTSSSWAFINSILLDFYKDRPPGFFIEAGALDGEYLSNTLYLEKNLSWTGLLVESNRNNYKVLKSKNRKCWTSSLCLGVKPCPYEAIFKNFNPIHSGTNEFWMKRGSSELIKKGKFDFSTEIHLVFEKVICVPIHYLLNSLNISKVDFFSLDVQGVELDVLKNFPFEKIKVDLWAIEHFSHYVVKQNIYHTVDEVDFIKFMETKGYYLFDIRCDVVRDYIFLRIGSELFESLRVPAIYWKRDSICLEKPVPKIWNENIHNLRDKRHWPTLKFNKL